MRDLIILMQLVAQGNDHELTVDEKLAVRNEIDKTHQLIDSTDELLNQLEDEVPFGELIEG